jgi:hypothetical protein
MPGGHKYHQAYVFAILEPAVTSLKLSRYLGMKPLH